MKWFLATILLTTTGPSATMSSGLDAEADLVGAKLSRPRDGEIVSLVCYADRGVLHCARSGPHKISELRSKYRPKEKK